MDYERLSLLIPKIPEAWTQDDVGQWLQFAGLKQLIPNFSNFEMIFRGCLNRWFNYTASWRERIGEWFKYKEQYSEKEAS